MVRPNPQRTYTTLNIRKTKPLEYPWKNRLTDSIKLGLLGLKWLSYTLKTKQLLQKKRFSRIESRSVASFTLLQTKPQMLIVEIFSQNQPVAKDKIRRQRKRIS